jgi:hypothetical protein
VIEFRSNSKDRGAHVFQKEGRGSSHYHFCVGFTDSRLLFRRRRQFCFTRRDILALRAAAETYVHYKTDLKAPSRVLLGTAVGSLPGLGKELTDSEFSGSDMAADVCGAFLGALIANL